ncbi:hypothetical protein KUTeg_010706 [Tegillarca granosa]|uniref:SSD domain-containing protein n=1 Tax=Tegillarca granosa TaxID=220873 RepID=A0ABQ9F577_TEGGR|nr:hypothetical protein KUTeg_010706 [Tegillarca granosa]
MKSFLITLGGHLFLVVLSGILFLAGFELFPTNFSTLPAELYNIPYRLRDFEWRHRNKYTNKVTRTINSATITYARGYLDALSSIDLWYDTGGGNIFTKSNFQKIQQIENDLSSVSTYQNNFCMTANSSLTCKSPRSIIRFFDGTYSSVNAIFNDPSFNNIPAVLYEAYTNTQTKLDFEYFLPKTFIITPTSASASYTRSLLLIGCSLSGTSKCSDDMEEYSKTFLSSEMKPKLESWRSSAPFDMYYYSRVLWASDTVEQAMKDMMLAIGSMLFIFCFILFHTRSAWVSCWSIMSIFTSFLGTNIIYRCIIGYQYFGFFHILSIFIILGIGADDLFVFYDTWRLSAFSSYPSLAHRVSDVYKKSALSMFITSLTTMIAFFASAISPLLATQSFGVFSGLLVAYNYISVIVFFPTVIVTYHLKFEKWTWPCFRKCPCCHNNEDMTSQESSEGIDNKAYTREKNDNSKESDIKTGKHYDSSPYTTKTPKTKTAAIINTPKYNDLEDIENTDIEDLKSQNDNTNKSEDCIKTRPTHQRHQKKMVIFFRDYYFKFITHKIIRWVLMPLFVGVVVFFAYQASRLEPDNDSVSNDLYKSVYYPLFYFFLFLIG